jgi:hypothetical protein
MPIRRPYQLIVAFLWLVTTPAISAWAQARPQPVAQIAADPRVRQMLDYL